MGFHAGISALLFRGSISIQNSGWLSPLPLQHFVELAKCMKSEDKYLYDKINTIGTAYIHNTIAYGEIINKYSNEVGDRIKRVCMIIPGTNESYKNLQQISFDAGDLKKLRQLLNTPEFYIIAYIDFIFLAHEKHLEFNNTELTCKYIRDIVNSTGGFDNILFNCLLHRIASLVPLINSKKNDILFSNIVTDSNITAELLDKTSHISSCDTPYERHNDDQKIDMIAYRLFDGALGAFYKKNGLIQPQKIGDVFKNHYCSLESLRTKCKIDASEIIQNTNNSNYIVENRIKYFLSAYNKEVTEILSLKSRILEESYKKITEDPVVWSAFLAGIVAIQTGCPSFLSISAAITAISKIGVSTLKSKREIQKKAKDSPMSIFMHLK